ncbi:MAG: type II toxin-antitoxin system VapC family toxin [Blastocatellia bacterium]|nr:type II toxin-antitoxin system VapC family toxin [Blastocatellia bacterium]
MALSLKDIPDGSICFLDATIFYYHFVNHPPLSDDCSDLLARIGAGAIKGVTSSVALTEAAHKVMLAEVIRQNRVPLQGLLSRIKKHPELLDHVAEHKQVYTLADNLDLSIEPITLHIMKRGAELSPQRHLLTNDVLILAVIETLGLTHIATNDDDFDYVPGLNIFKPARI